MSSRDGELRPDGHRRKWDRNEYEKKAKARSREERGVDADDENRASSSKKGMSKCGTKIYSVV